MTIFAPSIKFYKMYKTTVLLVVDIDIENIVHKEHIM